MHNFQISEEQKRVIEFPAPAIVLAGPGSGKTTTICAKIAHDITRNHVTPQSILAVTFSASGVERMLSLLPRFIGETAYHVPVKTIHRISWDLIRKFPNFFLGKADRGASSINIAGYDETKAAAEEVLTKIGNTFENAESFVRSAEIGRVAIFDTASKIKDELKGVASYFDLTQIVLRSAPSDQRDSISNAIILDSCLLDKHAFSISGLPIFAALFNFAHLESATNFAKNVQRIYYDEFQDTSQIDLAVMLPFILACQGNIVVAGDPFQTIFSFRGALGGESFSIIGSLIESTTGRKPTTLFLTENHRNPEEIIGVSLGLINEVGGKLALSEAHRELYKRMSEHYQRRMRTRPVESFDNAQSLYLFSFGSWQEEVRWMVQIIRNMYPHLGEKQVAIIIPTREQGRDYLQEIERQLIINEIPFYNQGKGSSLGRAVTLKILAAIALISTNNYDSKEVEVIAKEFGIENIWKRFMSDEVELVSPLGGEDMFSQFVSHLAKITDKGSNKAENALMVFKDIEALRASFNAQPNLKAEELLRMICDPNRPVGRFYDKVKSRDVGKYGESFTKLITALNKKAEDFSAKSFALWLNDAIQFSSGDPLVFSGGYQKQAGNRVVLLPLRSAKGLEYDVVFWPMFGNTQIGNALTEKLFLTFTGITRARDALVLSFSTSSNARPASSQSPELYVIESKRLQIAGTQGAKARAVAQLLMSVTGRSSTNARSIG